MALYSIIKPMGQKLLKPFVDMFSKVDPNFLTLWGLIFSALAGACFLFAENRVWLLVAIPFILLRMAFNVIDGMVARQTGKTSAYGEALAEFTDRLSDSCIIMGMAFSIYCHATFGLLGLVAVLIVSYVGILSKAVGADRKFGGLMGKVDRLILIMVFCLAQYLFPHVWVPAWEGFKNFDLLMALLIMGSGITVFQRWQMIRQQLTGDREKNG